ncbi:MULTISPECIES: hypothetical protein [unclassified Kribbella]|uniref:hypothetical protein n=1 Tax=unclassified Kribbella TaxID=2644121 RepID=UPI0033D6897E|nr:hypothetical protein OG817_11840 [Kribbella sp. NBC_00889]
MRWLITVPADFDLDALAAAVTAAAGSLGDEEPIPLGDDELAVYAEGPADLPRTLHESISEVLKVSPNSEPEPY